ncbi:MAG: hypothetical protein WCA37_00845 [Terracidiphilus sp.]
MLHKDVCITAHVYDVVELPDGTRYLDVCSPDTPDEKCVFTILNPWQDREEVGELRQYRNLDVHIRGIVEPMHGRAAIVLSHVRQFNGGPPRFRPNPLLLHGFTGDQSRPPVRDPNLHTSGSHRSFMNATAREPVTPAASPSAK